MITKQKGIPSANYTRIPNSVIRDGSLSLSGIGLFCVLSSLPENWDLSIYGLASNFGFTEGQVRSSLRELLDLGYLVRTQERKAGKFVRLNYRICDLPHAVKPDDGLPHAGLPGPGFRRQYNKRTIKEKK